MLNETMPRQAVVRPSYTEPDLRKMKDMFDRLVSPKLHVAVTESFRN